MEKIKLEAVEKNCRIYHLEGVIKEINALISTIKTGFCARKEAVVSILTNARYDACQEIIAIKTR